MIGHHAARVIGMADGPIMKLLLSVYEINYFAFLHRARTAFRAISDLRFGGKLAARAFPPFEAPNLESATAAGFFFFFVMFEP